MTPEEVVRALYATLERGESLAKLFTEDARTIEHPNRLKPKGAVSPRDVMIANSEVGASILATQRYDVHSVLALGDVVAVRLTWSGVLARDAGSLRAGQSLVAHVAQFVQVREDRIASIETYDCYEPFE
jgi:ketosteroid isomerase-like protein